MNSSGGHVLDADIPIEATSTLEYATKNPVTSASESDKLRNGSADAFKLGSAFCIDEPRPMKVVVIGAGFSGISSVLWIGYKYCLTTAQVSLLEYGSFFPTLTSVRGL